MDTVNVTIRVPKPIKFLFDSTSNIHGRNISEIANEGIISFLTEVSPVETLEIDIKQREEELTEVRKYLAKAQIIEQEQKKESKKKESCEQTNPVLDNLRNKKFSEHIESIIRQMQLGTAPSWDRLAPLYQFSTPNDMKNWFFSKMAEEGITV